MVKIMRNVKKILTLTLICAFSLLMLGACGDTTAEAETETDGTIYLIAPKSGHGFCKNLNDEHENDNNIRYSAIIDTIFSSLASNKLPISIKNVESCNKPIIYADSYNGNAENAVITSKWLYYASLMLANYERKDFYSFGVQYTPQLYAAIGADPEYCLEKVSLTCYYNKNYSEAVELLSNNSLSECLSECCDLLPEQTKYFNQVVAAALYRYGDLDLNGFENKIGLLKFNETGNCKVSSLNVVGYYETDADKILSTGVSLDTESDEYKTVMAQLNNPVIYSLCGNFVNE